MLQPGKRRIGAGTVLLISALVVIVGVTIYRHTRHTAPIIERTVTGDRATRGIAPAPEFLTRHRRELALTDQEYFAIIDLAAAYRTEIQGASKGLRKATATYDTFIEAQKNAQKVNLQALSNATAEVSRLSGLIAASRHTYWTKACAVLTPEQQRIATELASHALASDLE